MEIYSSLLIDMFSLQKEMKTNAEISIILLVLDG